MYPLLALYQALRIVPQDRARPAEEAYYFEEKPLFHGSDFSFFTLIVAAAAALVMLRLLLGE